MPSINCQRCGEPFARAKLKGGPRQRFCSSRCRTATHRDTRPPAKQAKTPIENIGELDRPSLQNRATAPLGHQGSPGVGEGLLSAPATFVTESPKAHIGRPSRHPKAIPDAVYPGMWRVRWPDGRVSDMTNLSRVNDAIACFLGAA